MSATYHDKSGKFCKSDSAHTVTKDGERYKVVRQHRRVGSKKKVQKESGDPFRRLELAKQRAALLGDLTAPGWVNVHEVLSGE